MLELILQRNQKGIEG
jgi:hypothetical protein